MKHALLAAALTVTLGVLWFLVSDVLPRRDYEMHFAESRTDFGPLETITGVPYPIDDGSVSVTEPLAHVRVPFTLLRRKPRASARGCMRGGYPAKPWRRGVPCFGRVPLHGKARNEATAVKPWSFTRTNLAKRLELTTTFRLADADVLEVGIRKSDFWLDYERLPLGHRILDKLGEEAQGGWHVLRSDRETVFLNPRYENRYASVEEFLAQPPTDGIIGLYGNAALSHGSVSTAPFRVTDDPKQFRAIYTRYVPTSPSTETRTATVSFPLDRAYQNPDGSFDLMFFTGRADGKPVRVVIEKLRGTIEPTVPKNVDLIARVRRAARSLLIRSAAPS